MSVKFHPFTLFTICKYTLLLKDPLYFIQV